MERKDKINKQSKIFQILVSSQSKQLTCKTLRRLSKKIQGPSESWRKLAATALLMIPADSLRSILRSSIIRGYDVNSLLRLDNSPIVSQLERITPPFSFKKFFTFKKKQQYYGEKFQFLEFEKIKKMSLKKFFEEFPDPEKFDIFYFEDKFLGFKNKNKCKIGDLLWEKDKEKLIKFKRKMDNAIELEYKSKKDPTEKINLSLFSETLNGDKFLEEKLKKNSENFFARIQKKKWKRKKISTEDQSKKKFRIRSSSRKRGSTSRNFFSKLRPVSSKNSRRETEKKKSFELKKLPFSRKIEKSDNRKIFALINCSNKKEDERTGFDLLSKSTQFRYRKKQFFKVKMGKEMMRSSLIQEGNT